MEALSEYYNKKKNYGINSSRQRKILSLLGSVENSKILDVGCAAGYLGEKIKRPNNEVIGVDISRSAVNEAKKKIDQAFTADLLKDPLPFEDGYFDQVILAEVIEHLFYPEKALKKIGRVMKKEGRLVITTPNFLVISNRLKMLGGHFCYTEEGFLERGHIHFFTYSELVKILEENGFGIEKEDHLAYWRAPSFLACLWPSLFAFQFIVRAVKRR